MKLDADGANFHPDIRALLASDLPDTEKLARAFAAITAKVSDSARRDIELSLAMGDREAKVKHQVRLETMETARKIFRGCYLQVTGRKAWDEQDER
jgi:hypothetical protein